MSDNAVHQETLGFQTEVSKLLDLVIHSLYSNKDIFLRELISNASDAIDKLRFAAITDKKLLESGDESAIKITFDKDANTVTISDNGIGMNRAEIIENLGTIAKSGTHEFLKSLTGDKAKDSHLIGQFGVGFYSAYIIADKVTVESRRAGEPHEQGVRWISDGKSQFTVEDITKATCGTNVTLHLKKDEDSYLNDWTLRSIITKYSDHICVPILMDKEVTEEIEASGDTEGEDKPEPKTTIIEETVNRAKALWTLPKSEINDQDYKELYKHISHDFEDPMLWSHNKVEGKQEYTTLLYIPNQAPFDLWNRDRVRGLKLYVKRVFIMDEAEQFLPHYLRFVKGVIDSSDLPLNISREILQNNKLVESIRSGVSKRVLSTLEKLAKDDSEQYAKFWTLFGQVIKEGPGEDFNNRERIAKLLRFSSTQNDSSDQKVSLDDYLNRMKPGQDKIYYITADSFLAAKNSPHLEIFRNKGIEVLLLSEPVDEWLAAHLTEFEGKSLQSVAKGDVDLSEVVADKDKPETPESKEEKAKKEQDVQAEFDGFVKQVKDVLGDKIKDARISHRLTSSPACLVADEQDPSAHMQRILQAAGQDMPQMQPVFEINPDHQLIQQLKAETDDDRFAEWVTILFDQSLLAEGGRLEDPAGFVARLNKMFLNLSK